MSRSGDRGWQLGEGGDADGEVADARGEVDELGGVGEVGREVGAVLGRVAAEAEEVLDAVVAVAADDLVELRRGCGRRR